MRQIRINEKTDNVAKAYYKKMESDNIRSVAIRNLETLLDKFNALYAGGCMIHLYKKGGNNLVSPKCFATYIECLLGNYDKLQTLRPALFDKEIKNFENILMPEIVTSKFTYTSLKDAKLENSLAKQIIEAMKYKDIREKIYPSFIRKFGIRTCVYCNANYAITDADGNAYYDLDHWKPKALYPFLCTSFYNLQPSCPSCNRRKGNDNSREYFHLWDDSGCCDLEPLYFYLNPEYIINYLLGFKNEGFPLAIEETSVSYKKLVEKAKEKFHIEDVYKEHGDVVEEIIWKYQIYNDSYLSVTETLLRGIRTSDNADYKVIRDRFVMGNYCNPEDIHKRPLSKMTQDIGKQLGLL